MNADEFNPERLKAAAEKVRQLSGIDVLLKSSKTIVPGIYDMPAEKYHADPCPEPSLSCSVAKILLAQSPQHAWLAHPRLNPDFAPVEKKEYDLGSGAHDLLLEGGSKVAVIDPARYPAKNGNIPTGWTNDAIREARDLAREEGKHPVLLSDFEAMKLMRVAAEKAIFTCTDLSGIRLAAGRPEQTVIWKERGIWLRARIDWLSIDRRLILDYKTTTDATPAVFNRQITRMGYHIQEAFYRRGIKALTKTNPEFVILAQENVPPYGCSFHAIDAAMQEIADAKVESAIRMWASCLKASNWPGYHNQIHWCGPSTWQMQEHEEELAAGIPYDPAKMWGINERKQA